jgi:hypothetical protein
MPAPAHWPARPARRLSSGHQQALQARQAAEHWVSWSGGTGSALYLLLAGPAELSP